MKMDCKGAELFLTSADLLRVRQFVKLEYTLDSGDELKNILHLIKNSGFAYCVVLHNPEYKGPLSRHGTIYASKNV